MMKTGYECPVFIFPLYRTADLGYNKSNVKLKEMRV